MPLTESLTVQILGDSSGLQQELSSVAELLDGLQQQLSAATSGAAGFGDAFGGISSALGSLQALSSELSLIGQQLQQLSSQPLTLNVQPALDALTQLMQGAQAAAAQLAALSTASLVGTPAAPSPLGALSLLEEGGEAIPRAFAGGGIVTGPGGIDQVSARLTAGEFVLNQDAVATLGLNQLERWNRGAALTDVLVPDSSQRPLSLPPSIPAWGNPASRCGLLPVASSPAPQTTNHFGGIEIHVEEASDVGHVMQDLRRQGIGLRHRWG